MPEPGLVPDLSPVLVAAGGTGGHLFPAEALAAALAKRGVAVHLATDRRAARFGGAFADQDVHLIASATLRARNPITLTRTAATLGLGIVQARALLAQLKPAAAIGFGGYPTVPTLLAAVWRGVPTLIHDANAVIGRANRLLAPRVSAIATTFPDVFAAEPALAAKATLTGNPVRSAVVAAAAIPYPAGNDSLRLVIFGGSQGAHAINMAMLAALPHLERYAARLEITHQTGEKDAPEVAEAYRTHGFNASVVPFIQDMAAAYQRADLVICRAGATTIAEVTACGKACLFIPFPHAVDDHQRRNAEAFLKKGAGFMLLERELSGERLAGIIHELAENPETVQRAGALAFGLARLDAARIIVDEMMKQL